MNAAALSVAFALLPGLALAQGDEATPWAMVVRDRERIVEIDRSSIIQSDGGTKVAWGRIVLSPERAAVEGYASVKALNRYDCYNRSFSTVKRVYLDARHIVIREESSLDETPVLAAKNTVDERLWQEVCKPPSVTDLERIAREVAKLAETARVDAGGAPPAKPLEPVQPPAAGAAPVRAEAPRAVKDVPEGRRAPQAAAPKSAEPAAKASARGEVARRAPMDAPAVVAGFREPIWSYEGETGPANWGKLRPDWAVCAEGKRQSPIDLRDGVAVDLEPPRFDYRETHFRITDTGRTLRVEVGPGMGVEIRGRRYELEFFEFHRPSVERIGGQASDMVVHFHHRDADGKRAVVAVLLDLGADPHPLIQTLWNSLPLERGTAYMPAVTIDLASLLPASPAHYLYMGSLVTPPCTEGVLWVVMKESLQLSADQLGVFVRLYPRNGRPIQPSNGRLILESR